MTFIIKYKYQLTFNNTGVLLPISGGNGKNHMMQYSVYVRHCASSESADVHEKRIHRLLPPLGKVSVLRITDKQFGNILNFWGKAEVPKEPQPTQLELF